MKNENIDYYKKLIKELIETNNSIDEVPIDDKYYGQIYAIINTVSLKIYVGKTIHRKVIGGRYKNKLRNHHNPHLINSLKDHKFEDFKIVRLGVANSKEELNQMEIYFIDKYNCLNNECGYNIANGGDGGNNWIGLTETEKKQRGKKISENQIGEKNSFYGKHHTEESKKKIGSHFKFSNNPFYDVHLYGENAYFYGHKHTNETKKLMSENHYDCRGDKNPRSRTVICLNDFNIFTCISDVEKHYGIGRIVEICEHKLDFIRKNKDSEKLVFLYIEEFDPYNSNEQKQYYLDIANNSKKGRTGCANKKGVTKKKTVCVTTKEYYSTMAAAERNNKQFGVKYIKLHCINKNNPYSGQLPDGTPLQWQFLDDYLKEHGNDAIKDLKFIK